MRVTDVDTPALLLDLDMVERNLDRMATLVAATPVKLRPHAKTHKTARIAQMQLERGAIGVCSAKLAEAEVLADGGIPDILITTEIVGVTKIRRLLALAARTMVTIVVDDARAAAALSEAANAAGLRLDTLVDVDVGQHRTGTLPGAPAVALGTLVNGLPGLRLRGLQGYEGHVQHIAGVAERRAANADAMSLLCATAAAFTEAGLATGIVTTGGTGTALFSAAFGAITDVQPGSYVVMDAQYGDVDGRVVRIGPHATDVGLERARRLGRTRRRPQVAQPRCRPATHRRPGCRVRIRRRRTRQTALHRNPAGSARPNTPDPPQPLRHHHQPARRIHHPPQRYRDRPLAHRRRGKTT